MNFNHLLSYFENQRDEFIDLMQQLIRFPSYSGDRKSINNFADFLEKRFCSLGLKACRTATPVGDIIQFDLQPESDDFLVLLAHMDTVQVGTEPPAIKFADPLLYGNGAFDMKNGITQFYYIMKACLDLGIQIKNRIKLIFTPDEETGSLHSMQLLKNECRDARAVLLPEPSCPDGGVKTSRKGVVSISARLKGKSAHSGIEPEKGQDANRGLMHLISKIDKILEDHPGVTFNPGIISGGNRTNMTSGESELSGELRSFSNRDINRVSKKLKNIKNLHGLIIHIKTEEIHPPLEPTPANRELYNRARRISRELGHELPSCSSGGSSDGSSLSQLGIPVLDGLGMKGGGAHSEGEYIDVSDFAFRASLLTALCREISND